MNRPSPLTISDHFSFNANLFSDFLINYYMNKNESQFTKTNTLINVTKQKETTNIKLIIYSQTVLKKYDPESKRE